MFTLTKNLQLYIQTLNGGMRGNVGYCFHLVAYVWTSLQHLGIEGMESKSSCCELPQQAQAKCCVKMEVCVYAPLNKCLGTQQGKSSPPPLTKKKKSHGTKQHRDTVSLQSLQGLGFQLQGSEEQKRQPFCHLGVGTKPSCCCRAGHCVCASRIFNEPLIRNRWSVQVDVQTSEKSFRLTETFCMFFSLNLNMTSLDNDDRHRVHAPYVQLPCCDVKLL